MRKCLRSSWGTCTSFEASECLQVTWFSFMCRPRAYSLLIRRQFRRGLPPDSMQDLYDAVVRDMAYQAPEDATFVFCAPRGELLEVENAARARRGLPFLPGQEPTCDWTYLLTPAQKLRLDAHEAKASVAGIQVFDLGQRADWSSCTARIPTFRRNTAVVWSRQLRRWMTKKERLACMVFLSMAHSHRQHVFHGTTSLPRRRALASATPCTWLMSVVP